MYNLLDGPMQLSYQDEAPGRPSRVGEDIQWDGRVDSDSLRPRQDNVPVEYDSLSL